jgi:putative hydrolase of the HAD superfamily
MLGDSIDVDIIGAMNAGIDQVFINHLNIPVSVRPTYMFNSLKELEKYFRTDYLTLLRSRSWKS